MDDIIKLLCKLYFTKLEAEIYMVLLKDGELSGYQIAKRINISRSSVYAALEPMYEKGIVLKLADDVQIYKAENPAALFSRLKSEFDKNADAAETSLKSLYEDKKEERFTNIKGYDTVVAKAKEMLLASQNEVYINTDFDLHQFEYEFKELSRKGVRVIVFSFAPLNHDGLNIEFLSHNSPCCTDEMPSRIMLVSDFKTTLVADTYKSRGVWFGTVTNNALMVSIITEHIHNDIYLLRLKNKYGNEIIDENIRLHSMFENRELV